MSRYRTYVCRRILAYLNDVSEASISDVALHFNITFQAVHSILERYRYSGLLRRARTNKHYTYYITDSGRRRVQYLRKNNLL